MNIEKSIMERGPNKVITYRISPLIIKFTSKHQFFTFPSGERKYSMINYFQNEEKTKYQIWKKYIC